MYIIFVIVSLCNVTFGSFTSLASNCEVADADFDVAITLAEDLAVCFIPRGVLPPPLVPEPVPTFGLDGTCPVLRECDCDDPTSTPAPTGDDDTVCSSYFILIY